MTRPRSRLIYLLLVAVTVGLGLATRRFGGALPAVIAVYGGDVLWASMVYLLVATLWNRASIRRVAFRAALVCVFVELSQLYHAPWIEFVRDTRIGGLMLGFGFLWSDVLCYAVGIALAAALDWRLMRSGRSAALTSSGA